MERGGRILQLNGIGVWHPSPARKHTDYIAYYDMRNMLIAMLDRCEMPLSVRALKRLLFIKVLQNCLGYRYGAAFMCLRGCEDFCGGVARFKETSPDRLHQELLAQTATNFIAVDCIPKDSLHLVSEEKRISPIAKILRYIFPSGKICYAEAGCNYPSYLGHRRVILVNEKLCRFKIAPQPEVAMFKTLHGKSFR